MAFQASSRYKLQWTLPARCVYVFVCVNTCICVHSLGHPIVHIEELKVLLRLTSVELSVCYSDVIYTLFPCPLG